MKAELKLCHVYCNTPGIIQSLALEIFFCMNLPVEI